MWFKLSLKTVALLKKGNWLFYPFWFGILVYLSLRGAAVISSVWDKIFFLVLIVWMLVATSHWVRILASAHADSKRSQHPDPDVAALIDKEIDIAEFTRRREERAKSERSEAP